MIDPSKIEMSGPSRTALLAVPMPIYKNGLGEKERTLYAMIIATQIAKVAAILLDGVKLGEDIGLVPALSAAISHELVLNFTMPGSEQATLDILARMTESYRRQVGPSLTHDASAQQRAIRLAVAKTFPVYMADENGIMRQVSTVGELSPDEAVVMQAQQMTTAGSA